MDHPWHLPNPHGCPVTRCMGVLGGKWKPQLLYLNLKGCNRFNSLLRALPSISRQTLAKQLKELVQDGVFERMDLGERPLRVEYRMTPQGRKLLPVIEAMRRWGAGGTGGNGKQKGVGMREVSKIVHT